MENSFIDVITRKAFTKYELVDAGFIHLFPFLRTCGVKILMVVDGTISFNHAYFGLSHVLDVLRNNPEFYVKFDVTRAHRSPDIYKPDQATEPIAWERYGPHFEGFTFTQAGFDLDAYDQVWFFGFSGEGGSSQLTVPELEILAKWMDNGGGVFATGDHADLGAALCSKIPRVRSMRRWTAAQGVPPATTPARHDTLLKGSDADYTFDDESDDIPMVITPKFYHLASWSPFIRRKRPHPILCGQDGVIDIMPDHPHEGEIINVSAIDLSAKFSFGAYTNRDEYPGSATAAPEVIAWGHVQGDHSSTGFKSLATAKSFGVLGAYDGHAVGVGRVAVDSTWHHWFDVNLIGRPVVNLDSFPMNATNPKTEGFLASVAGMNALSRIDNYFRNVALWLSPAARQKCMFLKATWGIVLRYPLVERLTPAMALWELGGTAIDAIGRRTNKCVVSRWIFDLFPLEIQELFRVEPFPEPEPCLTCPPFDLIEQIIMGGITREMLRLAYLAVDKGYGQDREMDEKLVLRAFNEGARAGVEALGVSLRKSAESSQERASVLTEILSKLKPLDLAAPLKER